MSTFSQHKQRVSFVNTPSKTSCIKVPPNVLGNGATVFFFLRIYYKCYRKVENINCNSLHLLISFSFVRFVIIPQYYLIENLKTRVHLGALFL